jgi:hypothetical protein
LIFYMLRDKATGLYYKRHASSWMASWVPQNKASVWTTAGGPQTCLGFITKWNRLKARCAFREKDWKPTEPEIVTIPVDRPKITLVTAYDWEGLYIDGKLVTEGHTIHANDLFRLMGINGQEIHADDAWLGERGGLPKNLDEVKRG